ncbi:hypothetical protein [Acetatifactor aquisgranensis]|jgi:hypothetical protein|nr:hypothetical protein [Acetatifactor aquisgranensis]
MIFKRAYPTGKQHKLTFWELLGLFGKSPEDFGFELCVNAGDMEEL